MPLSASGPLWWGGWYGGVNLPSYSVLSGSLMHLTGVSLAGVAAALFITIAGSILARGCSYPRGVAALIGAATVLDLFSGRVTFGLGMAAATWALVAMTRQKWVPAGALGLIAGLISPLTALVLFCAMFAFPGTRKAWMPSSPAAMVALLAALPPVVVALALPGPSTMPFDVADLLPVLAVGAVTLFCCRRSVVTAALAVAYLGVAAAFTIASPVGVNSTRDLMLASPALVLALGVNPRRTVIGVLLVSIWPVANTASDLISGSGPSADSAYYTALLAHLPTTTTFNGRVEVVDPATHGADQYVAARFPLARGWERQIDVADNPLFYTPTLAPGAYRAWLDRLAVSWVALPQAPLDYGSRSEGRLVQPACPI